MKIIKADEWRSRIKVATLSVLVNSLKVLVLLIAGLIAVCVYTLRLLAHNVKNNPLPTYVISMALMVVICVYREVEHKMSNAKQSRIIYSLANELDSVKNVSCYDSGYAAGLRKATLLFNNQENTYGRKIRKKSELNGKRQTCSSSVSKDLVQKERGGAKEAHQTSNRMEEQPQGGSESLSKEKILGEKGF